MSRHKKKILGIKNFSTVRDASHRKKIKLGNYKTQVFRQQVQNIFY